MLEDSFKRGPPAFRDPVLVVDFPRAVDAQADQEPVLLEELAPFLVDQRAVGLEIVLDPLERLGVFLFERDDLAEEIQPHQRRLAALPGEHHLRPGHARDVLLDEPLEHLVGHPAGAGPAGQRFLAQVEAVVAVQVAGGTARLDHDVEPPPRLVRDQRRRIVMVEPAS